MMDMFDSYVGLLENINVPGSSQIIEVNDLEGLQLSGSYFFHDATEEFRVSTTMRCFISKSLT